MPSEIAWRQSLPTIIVSLLIMDWHDRIIMDPKMLVGKPVIKGTRIAVEFLVELLANGWTHEQILKNYPHLTREDIQAALRYGVA